MPRLRHRRYSASCGAGLVLACVALCGADALAQDITSAVPLNGAVTDPRNPPRFRSVDPTAVAQVGPPLNFTPPPDAEGTTGYDSSNAKKKRKAQPTPKAAAAAAPPPVQAVTAATPPLASPYQTRGPGLPNLPAMAASARAQSSPPQPESPYDSPGTTQPKRRKAHVEIEDPYLPLGLRTGSFLLFPAIELSGGYDTNPQRAANGSGASLYTVAPELLAQSNWSRHELKADLRGSYTGFSPDQTPTLSRPNFNGKVDGRIDVTHNTRIELGTRLLVATEDPGSPNLPAGLAELPIFTTFGGSAGVAHRFNRFEIGVKADAERTVFQDSELTDGTTASNEDRNYDQYGGTVRGSYEWSPSLKPFVEVGADTRVHDLAVDFFGYRRDSTGQTVRAGADFEFSRLLTGTFSLGYVTRDYDDPRLAQLTGFIGDAALAWSATALTTATLTAKSTVGESREPGVSGILYRDAGVQVDHSFRRWLIGTVKLGIGQDDYVGGAREDMRYSAGIGLTYKLNRFAQVKGELRQEWMRSDIPANDYEATIFMLGLRLQR